MSNQAKTYVLRGFIKEAPGGRFVGVYLRPSLVVEADSKEEAFQKLHVLLGAYLMDATRDGQLEYFMSRRAPLKFYFEYCFGRVSTWLRSARRPFVTFTETCPVHA